MEEEKVEEIRRIENNLEEFRRNKNSLEQLRIFLICVFDLVGWINRFVFSKNNGLYDNNFIKMLLNERLK